MREKKEMVTATATAAWYHCIVDGCRNAVSASKHHHRFHRDGELGGTSELVADDGFD